MSQRRAVGFFALVFTLLVSPAFAGRPLPADKAPSAMIFGTFGPELYPETLSYRTSTDPYQRIITVPSDGAWFFGSATIGGWMDCEHHYAATLSPTDGGYDPFYTLGATGTDVCFGSNCYSCSLNFNGQKGLTYYTTNEYPGYLPAGTYTVSVQTLNGGGADDAVGHYFAQVNQDAFESMSIYQAVSDTDPRPEVQQVVDGMFFFAGLGDTVPLTPVFKYGNWEFPGGPNITYSALWDRSKVETPARRGEPAVYNGLATVLVDVPLLSTGTHKLKLVARLPNGKTFTSAAMSVFVWHGDIETTYNGITTFSPTLSMTKGDVAGFRIVQRDGRKALDVVDGGWTFDSIGLTPAYSTTGAGDPSLATTPELWAGDMIESGIVKAKVKVQAGRIVREAHHALARTIIVRPRTGGEWDLQLHLAEDTFDDLGAANGGDLKSGFFFPSTRNLNAWAAIGNTPFWTIGVTGDARSYHTGLFDDLTGSVSFQPRRYTRSLPLYRPVGPYNDPEDYPTRFVVRRVPTGPWREFFYVTEQHLKIDRLWLTIAYLKDGSAIGQNPANYRSFQLRAGCTDAANPDCYEAVPISMACWTQLFGNRGYADAARNTFNPVTGQNFDVTAIQDQVRDHEPRVHWRQAIVDLLANEPANQPKKWDFAKVLERRIWFPTSNATEASVALALDADLRLLSNEWVLAPFGGQWEVSEPFISTMIFDDASGNCQYAGTRP